MTYLQDILNPAELDRLVAEKYIRRVLNDDGRLVLYNYTEKATFDRMWTPETRACRGLIADVATGEIVAWPFAKFANADEAGFPESAIEALLSRPGPVEITDKLDGSMVAVWCYDGVWHCSTRGSFNSTQALAARQWLETIGVQNWPTEYTFIGEWCAPDNRVVLKYERSELRLIGVREHSGHDCSYAELVAWSQVLGIPVVPAVVDGDLISVLSRREATIGVEGWVARWPDGFRVKIKTADYLQLHRLISGFSPTRVRDAMLTGDAARYMQELPEELRVECEGILFTLDEVCRERERLLRDAHRRLSPLLDQGRKKYALTVQQEPKEDWPFLFSLADNKPIADKVLKAVDLVTLFGEQSTTTKEQG